MLSLTDRDAVTAALTDPKLAPDLRALIGLRAWQLDVERDRPLGDIIQFVVVQPGDASEVFHRAVGFPDQDRAARMGVDGGASNE